MPHQVTTRRAEESDGEFAYSVRESTMRVHVVATWGTWNERQARTQIAEDIVQQRLTIVEVDSEPMGMLRIDEHASHTDIDQLFLLPEYQRQGIGTKLVESVLRAAKQKNIAVNLWVLKVNSARAFYERLGFHVFEETATSVHLRSAA